MARVADGPRARPAPEAHEVMLQPVALGRGRRVGGRCEAERDIDAEGLRGVKAFRGMQEDRAEAHARGDVHCQWKSRGELTLRLRTRGRSCSASERSTPQPDRASVRGRRQLTENRLWF